MGQIPAQHKEQHAIYDTQSAPCMLQGSVRCTFSRCCAYGSFRKMLCRVPESSVTRRLLLPWLSGSLLRCSFALRWPETSMSKYPNFEGVFKFCPEKHATRWRILPEKPSPLYSAQLL